MRLLILSQYFFPEVGATQTRMYEFARHLASQGHRVTVVTEFPNHPHGRIPRRYRGRLFETERRDDFEIIRVRVWASPVKTFSRRIGFYGSYLILATLRSLFLPRPDVVLATSPPLPVGVGGYLVSRARRCRFLLDVRDLWPEAAVALGELRGPRLVSAIARVARFLYRKADQITVVTRGFQSRIGAMGIAADKLHWLPNGTIVDLFKPGPGCPLFRRESGMEGRFLVTFAGTLGIAQGLASVLQAAELCRDDPTIGFVLIGDGPVRSQLLTQQRQSQLSNVYIKEQVPLERIVPLLNASDALLVQLRKDPVFDTFVPSKLYDCMACAKPVLLGVNGEAASILDAARAGIRFDAENPKALLEAVRTLRDNPDLCERMGRRGREYVEKNFDRSRQAVELGGLLTALSKQDRDSAKAGTRSRNGW